MNTNDILLIVFGLAVVAFILLMGVSVYCAHAEQMAMLKSYLCGGK